MSWPILYPAQEKSFLSNGLGMLHDCISCRCIHEPPGLWELHIRFPRLGLHYARIQPDCLITAKLPYIQNPQIFVIYSVAIHDTSGDLDVRARHISYDLAGYPVAPFKAVGPSAAMAGILENASFPPEFSMASSVSSSAAFEVKTPRTARECLFGREGSLLDVYGGRIIIDNRRIMHLADYGQDRGFSVRYGKNLTNLQQDNDLSNFYTGVFPYWVNPDTEAVTQLPKDGVVSAPSLSRAPRIKLLDCSAEFDKPPTADQLRAYATRYIKQNGIGKPQVQLTASFERDDLDNVNALKLGPYDIVTVFFPTYPDPIKSRVVKLETNVLLDRVEKFSLGSVKRNLADSVSAQQILLDRLKRK